MKLNYNGLEDRIYVYKSKMAQLDQTSMKLQRNIQLIDDKLYVSRTVTIDKEEQENKNKELDQQNKKLKDKVNIIREKFEDV